MWARNDQGMSEKKELSNSFLRGLCSRFAIPFLLAMAFCLVAQSAAGHALVVKTSLRDHPVKPDTPTTVVFSFSQKVQLPLTKVLLENAHGDKRSLKLASGKQPGEVEVELPALPAGRYVLRYNVLAIDGHFTEGVVRFQVAAHQQK